MKQSAQKPVASPEGEIINKAQGRELIGDLFLPVLVSLAWAVRLAPNGGTSGMPRSASLSPARLLAMYSSRSR